MPDTSKRLLTVLCPVFNEELAIPLFYERFSQVMRTLQNDYDVNLLFLDNGSSDKTHVLVEALCRRDARVFSIALSRNFGYQASVECGLRTARGDLFVVIDVDCEDPPEMIPEFLKYYQEGFDIVYGERLDREENALMILGRKAFYRFTHYLSDDRFILDMAEFCLITSSVRDAIAHDNNSFPFIRASIGRVGFRIKNIPYKRHKRVAGKTHYNFRRMALFAVAGVLSSTTLPLRLPAYFFPFWLIALVALAVLWLLTSWSGCLPLMLALGFAFCGYTLAAMSIYLARTYKNGLNRPNFVVDMRKSHLQPGTAVDNPARSDR